MPGTKACDHTNIGIRLRESCTASKVWAKDFLNMEPLALTSRQERFPDSTTPQAMARLSRPVGNSQESLETMEPLDETLGICCRETKRPSRRLGGNDKLFWVYFGLPSRARRRCLRHSRQHSTRAFKGQQSKGSTVASSEGSPSGCVAAVASTAILTPFARERPILNKGQQMQL